MKKATKNVPSIDENDFKHKCDKVHSMRIQKVTHFKSYIISGEVKNAFSQKIKCFVCKKNV